MTFPKIPRVAALLLLPFSSCFPISQNNETDDPSKQPTHAAVDKTSTGLPCTTGNVCKEFTRLERDYCSKVEKGGKACETNAWAKDVYARVQAGLGENSTSGSKKLADSPLEFFNPFPKGKIAGYSADSGLDIMGDHLNVYAVAAGRVVYSEKGHTLWNKPPDTPNSVLIELVTPQKFKNRTITHVFYTHLASLAVFHARDNDATRYVRAGELLGVSGLGGGSPHLHLGLLLDNEVGQEDGTFLKYLDVRDALGKFETDDVLPN